MLLPGREVTSLQAFRNKLMKQTTCPNRMFVGLCECSWASTLWLLLHWCCHVSLWVSSCIHVTASIIFPATNLYKTKVILLLIPFPWDLREEQDDRMMEWCNTSWPFCMFISRLRDVFLFADGAGLQSSDGAFWWNQQQAIAYTSHRCVGVYVSAHLSPNIRCCYMERVIMCEQKHGCLSKLDRIILCLCNSNGYQR